MTELSVEQWRALTGIPLVEAMLGLRWYAMPNDLIGGWCVMPVPKPPSEGYPEVGSFMAQRIAEHVASLHNASLSGETPLADR